MKNPLLRRGVATLRKTWNSKVCKVFRWIFILLIWPGIISPALTTFMGDIGAGYLNRIILGKPEVVDSVPIPEGFTICAEATVDQVICRNGKIYKKQPEISQASSTPQEEKNVIQWKGRPMIWSPGE